MYTVCVLFLCGINKNEKKNEKKFKKINSAKAFIAVRVLHNMLMIN